MATEAELYQPDALAEDEPKYLRRQKPVEIRRRKFGRQAWKRYAMFAGAGLAVLVTGWGLIRTAHFLLYSPRFVLADTERIEVRGNQYVPRAVVLEKFASDAGRSVLSVPLAERRRALEEIAWVERAGVRRALPNRILVELWERKPVAFLRQGSELSLIDVHGVILERPAEGQFRFPVVTGIADTMPSAEREQRMKLLVEFLSEVERARAGASDHVSEVDLADPADVRAVLADMPELGEPATGGQGAVLVHFGSGDFVSKFQVLVQNMAEWRAAAGRVESVDLRFERQVVVNPEAQAAGKPVSEARP